MFQQGLCLLPVNGVVSTPLPISQHLPLPECPRTAVMMTVYAVVTRKRMDVFHTDHTGSCRRASFISKSSYVGRV